MAKTIDTISITLTQPALNLARIILSASGWAKTLDTIYLGGKLLSDTLPAPDLSWVKSEDDIKLMNPKQRGAYVERDRKWAAEKTTFTLTARECAAFKVAFEHVASEGKLSPGQYVNEVIAAFGLVKEE